VFELINFSPFASNVLDFVGAPDLRTPNGLFVAITHDTRGFTITIDGKPVAEGEGNVSASYALNTRNVGRFVRIHNGTNIRTITGGWRKLEAWTGVVMDACPTAVPGNGWRYEVIPDCETYPVRLDPGQTVYLYSGEITVK